MPAVDHAFINPGPIGALPSTQRETVSDGIALVAATEIFKNIVVKLQRYLELALCKPYQSSCCYKACTAAAAIATL